MKSNPLFLRLFALGILIFMVSFPFLCRHLLASNDIPLAEPEQIKIGNFPANLFRNAAAQPWFDSTAFRKIMRRGMYAPYAYSKREESGVSPELYRYSADDTAHTLLALEMSYEVRRFTRNRAEVFNAALKKMQQEIRSVAFYGNKKKYIPLADSINAFVYYKFGLTSNQQHTAKDFASIDSLFLMKYGWEKMILTEKKPVLEDTLWALKAIYKNTYLPKNQ